MGLGSPACSHAITHTRHHTEVSDDDGYDDTESKDVFSDCCERLTTASKVMKTRQSALNLIYPGLGATTIWEIDTDDLANIRPLSRGQTPKYLCHGLKQPSDSMLK